MKRKIVHIDESKCNGCGLCVPSCAEGAIQIIDGKARLVSDIYCDGLGACLGKCPMDAISITEREAEVFDADAAEQHVRSLSTPAAHSGCPGSRPMSLRNRPSKVSESASTAPGAHAQQTAGQTAGRAKAELTHWPVQLSLVPPSAPYFDSCDLLVAADCVPFAFSDFHTSFIKGRSVVVGCPKLDDAQFYISKLAEVLKRNQINSITVVHMEVPCCSGLVYIVDEALKRAGKHIPTTDVTISIDGAVKSTENLAQ